MPDFHGYRPLASEFYSIVRACAKDDPVLDEWANVGLVRVVPVDSGRVRFVVDNPPTGRRQDDRAHAWTPDRAQVVELIARTIECRSARWLVDEQRMLPMPGEWPDVLRVRWPGQFDCELSIGGGWVDLLIATQAWLDEHHADVSWSQIKQKIGGLRLYHGGLRGAFNVVDEIITIAEHVLSECICETCGSPGQVRDRNGWLYTACDGHVRA